MMKNRQSGNSSTYIINYIISSTPLPPGHD
uniref:Uncharacterized protein n=1 Tax=Anguilla anguilla TaxID=7936 RepID=A0A0E9TN81_ANGAN